MDLDLSAAAMLGLVAALFEGRDTVNKYDVVQVARGFELGADGERAVEWLPAGRYTQTQLTEALAAALIEASHASKAPAKPRIRRRV
jgi:hypothetical protein